MLQSKKEILEVTVMENEIVSEILKDVLENNNSDFSTTEDIPNLQTIEDLYYSSGQVADLLGKRLVDNADSVRYYAKEFEEFLSGTKTKGGHFRFSAEDVEILRTIFSLIKIKNNTPAEVKAKLRDPNIQLVLADIEGTHTTDEKQLLLNYEYLINRISVMMDDIVTKSLEEQANTFMQRYLLEDQQREEERKKLEQCLEELLAQNKYLSEKLDLTNERLAAFEAKETEIESKNQKKGFFGFFRK